MVPWLGQLANGTLWGLQQALLWCALLLAAVCSQRRKVVGR